MASTGTSDNSQTLTPTSAIQTSAIQTSAIQTSAIQTSAIQTSQGICAICLGLPENKSFASNCLHEFCFICLLEWSKVKAECPLCKQSFCSIIHNVKSDHEYDDLEIKKLGKRSSGALPSSTPLLQQQIRRSSVPSHATNVEVTAGNHLQAPTVPSRRKSVRIATRHGAVPPQSEQETVAWIDTTNIQQPQRKITRAVRHSRRLRNIIQEEMDTASNIELVNEPGSIISSSSMLSDALLVTNITAAPVRKSQWWHSFISADLRNRMVQKLVGAIISDSSFDNVYQMDKVGAYTRQIELDIYMAATSKDLYNTVCLEKMTELKNIDQPEKRIRLPSIQYGDYSSSLPQVSWLVFLEGIATQQVLVLSDDTHFTAENFIDTHITISEDAEDDDLAILDLPPKPAPEVITLSDSDDE